MVFFFFVIKFVTVLFTLAAEFYFNIKTNFKHKVEASALCPKHCVQTETCHMSK